MQQTTNSRYYFLTRKISPTRQVSFVPKFQRYLREYYLVSGPTDLKTMVLQWPETLLSEPLRDANSGSRLFKRHSLKEKETGISEKLGH